MFDQVTTGLIQQASPLEGLDLDRLPQFLTEAYAKVVAARLGAVELGAGQQDPEWASNVLELRRLAETYEGLAIFLPEDDPHRSACAFVAGSAGGSLDHKDVFPFVLARSADGLDGAAGDGNADVPVFLFPIRVGLNVVGVIYNDAAPAHRVDMAFVGMLVKGHDHVGFIARAQDFARADADLEQEGPPEMWRGWSWRS